VYVGQTGKEVKVTEICCNRQACFWEGSGNSVFWALHATYTKHWIKVAQISIWRVSFTAVFFRIPVLVTTMKSSGQRR